MKDGEIAEEGSYTELMAANGEFVRLAQLEIKELGNIYIYIYNIESVIIEEESKREEINNVETASNLELLAEFMNAEEEGIGQFEDYHCSPVMDYTFYPLDNLDKPIEMFDSHEIHQIGEIELELQKATSELAENALIDKNNISEAVGSRKGSEITHKKGVKSEIVKRTRANSVQRESNKKELERIKGKLITEEKQETGGIKCSNYLKILKYGGLGIVSLSVFVYCLSEIIKLLGTWWLGIWSVDKYNKDTMWYFQYYCFLGILFGIASFARSSLLGFYIRNLSNNSQLRLIKALLLSPLSWFDKTPTGRIINRAVKDQSTIDEEIPYLMHHNIRMGLVVLGSFILICIILPFFTIVLGILIILYMYWYYTSIQYARDSRRIEAGSKSPIFSFFNETLDGLTTLRACKLEKSLMCRMLQELDKTNTGFFANGIGLRWMNLRAEIAGSIGVASAGLLVILSKDQTDPNLAGLALSTALLLTTTLGYLLRFFGELEVKMASAERVIHYAHGNPQEKPFFYEEARVEDAWPEQGRLVVKDLQLRYQEDLPFVIKGISFVCEPGERIGVVGRTGSGKSTLTLGLLRILEAYSNIAQGGQGNIIIDGVDVANIGLYELREQIAMIPQDPVLFSGTIGSNLDPFERIGFDEKVKALELTGLLLQLYKKISEERALKDKHTRQTVETKSNSLVEPRNTNNPSNNSPTSDNQFIEMGEM